MSINKGSLTIVISSPQPSHAWESENVKLEKRRSYSTVRDFGEGGEKVVTWISSTLYVSLSLHPFVVVWSAQNLVFFHLAQMHREMTFTHWSGASLAHMHPPIWVDDWKKWFESNLVFHFSLLLTLWHNLQNQYTDEKRLIIHTKLIDGTLPVIDQSLSLKRIFYIRCFEAK